MFDNNLRLVLVPFGHFRTHLSKLLEGLYLTFAIAAHQARFTLLAKPTDLSFALGHRKARKNRIAFEHHVAFFSNLDRVVACLRKIGKRCTHLFFRFHIELVVRKPHAVCVIHLATGADTQDDVLRLGIVVRQIMKVVSSNCFKAAFLRDLRQLYI